MEANPLKQPVNWRETGDPFHPWAAEVEGQAWKVRLNEFPVDETLYTLFTPDEAFDFDDWPAAWKRP